MQPVATRQRASHDANVTAVPLDDHTWPSRFTPGLRHAWPAVPKATKVVRSVGEEAGGAYSKRMLPAADSASRHCVCVCVCVCVFEYVCVCVCVCV